MHHFRVECEGVQGHQGFGPFHAFCNAGCALKGAGKRLAAQTAYKLGYLLGQLCAGLWYLRAHHSQFALAIGVVHPLVQAAALDGIVQIAGAVTGENGDRGHFGFDGAQFWNAHLVLAQILQQKGFEGFVGAINFIDQQQRTRRFGLKRF